MTDQRSDDDRSSAKPQVIDLTAEEVRPGDSGAAQGASEADALRREEAASFSATPEAADAIRERHDSWSETSDDIERAQREHVARETDSDVASPPPPPPPPPAAAPVRKSSGKAAWVIAALAIGLLAGGWLYRDVLSSFFPNDEMAAMRVRLDSLESNAQALGNQVTAAGQSLEAATTAAAAASEEARAAQAGIAGLATRIDGLDQRIGSADEALAAARADLEELRKSISSPGVTTSGGGAVDGAALAALGQRIDALEKDVASLKSASGGSGNASATSALSQALSDLKAKVAAGTGYAAEYDRISRMVPAAPGLDVLASSAVAGLPGARGLAEELRAAIPALPQPEAPAPSPDGYWDTLLDSLSGIITVREIGEANWPQLAEKAASFAEAGDLTQAISAIDGAEGEKPMALTQWRDRAAARLRLEAALEQVSDAVLRQIAALGGVQ